MSVIYTNGGTGDRIELQSEQTCGELLELLGRLTRPESGFIAQLPSGLGLDFNLQRNGQLWVEFYARDELSGALVTPEVAHHIVQRAFEGETTGIKEKYADLIPQWEY